MRTLFKVSLAGAIALAAAVGCNKEVQYNPNYNSETKEVTTEFVLSVNTGTPSTRMNATNVQRNTNFLGIDGAHILAYSTDISRPSFEPEAFVLNPSATAARDFDLGTLFSNGSINAGTNQTASSNRIVQLKVPVDVDAILFYGKGINATPSSATGKLTYNVATTPSATHFDLVQRLEQEKMDSYNRTGDLLVFMINRIISTNLAAMTSTETYSASGDPKDPKTQYNGLDAISWPGLGADYDVPAKRVLMTPLEEILGAAYSTVTKIETNEYRAGSSAAVKSILTSLIDVVKSVQTANPTSNAEANACRLADAIMQRAGRYLNLTVSPITYLGLSSIKENVITNAASTGIADEAAWDAKFSGVTDIAGYPHSQFHIPDGAAQMSFNTTSGEFEHQNPNQALVTPNTSFLPQNYLYPAQLAYYVNSPINTLTTDATADSFPNGVNPWDDTSNTGIWKSKGWNFNSRVQSNTRGIAVRNNINYGVAMLESKIAIDPSISVFKDNKAAKANDTKDNEIPVNNHHLTLVGILVGGQVRTADWQFLPKVTSGSEFINVVYDDEIASSTIPTPTGLANYTLVLDNYNKTLADNAQSLVRVALEFKNEGDPFWGRDNIIPKDGIFYLCAELPVATATNSDPNNGPLVGNLPNWSDAGKYAIPPVYGVQYGESTPEEVEVPTGKVAGHSKQVNRIFIQNFVTSVTFTLGENSLKNAYVSIPNLASTQMSLGLSVDINWHTGYTYNITL